jgi:ankyrin repeat protein
MSVPEKHTLPIAVIPRSQSLSVFEHIDNSSSIPVENKDYNQESDTNVISNLDMKQEDKRIHNDNNNNNNNGDEKNKNSYQSDSSDITDENENIDSNNNKLGENSGNAQVNTGNKCDMQSILSHDSSDNNENANNRSLEAEYYTNSNSNSNSNMSNNRNSMNPNGAYGNFSNDDNVQISDIPHMQYKNTLTIAQQYSALSLREEVDTIDSLDDFNANVPFSTKEKLILLHLINLTCNSSDLNLNQMEEEIQSNIVFRVCLHTKSLKLIKDVLNKKVELAKTVLPTSYLNILHILVSSGNEKAVEYIISKPDFASFLDKPANNNVTPLHIACLLGLDSIVRLLLNKNASISSECSAVPFTRKVREGKAGFLGVLNYWRQYVWTSQTSNLQAQNNNRLLRPRKSFKHSTVVASGSVLIGTQILNTCGHYMNPLLMAVMSGSLATFSTVLEFKPDIDMRTASKESRLICDPFTLSCVMGYPHLAQLILDISKNWPIKFNPNITDCNNVSALILNSRGYGSGQIAEILCKAGTNLNHVDSTTGNSALHYAIINGYTDVLRGLINQKKGTNELLELMNSTNTQQYFTPLQLAHELNISGELSEAKYKAFSEMLIANGVQNKRVYNEIVKEGWLLKEGHIYKTIRQRFFILRKSGVLSYYKDIRKLKHPSGNIYLYNSVVQKEPNKRGTIASPLSFSIYDPTMKKKTYIFCDVEETRDAWIEALNFCISIAKKPSQ